jgi:hypothetical protein
MTSTHQDRPGPVVAAPVEPVVVEVPVPVPTWTAGSAAWWAVSVVLAAMAVALFTLLRTAAAFSEPEPAQAILEAVLHAPTAAAIDQAQLEAPDASVLAGRADLVAFEVRAAALDRDRADTVNQAVEHRAAELRVDGIPVDPGAVRTQTGLPRKLIESLSEQNHDVVARGVLLSAVLAAALLLFTVLQGRNDNLLVLPAGALALAWVLVTVGLQSTRVLLDGTGPATARVLRIIEGSAAAPRAQLAFAAVAGILAAAAYRAIVQVQAWRRRRALDRYRAQVASMPAVDAAPVVQAATAPDAGDDGVIDLEHELIELGSPPTRAGAEHFLVRLRSSANAPLPADDRIVTIPSQIRQESPAPASK